MKRHAHSAAHDETITGEISYLGSSRQRDTVFNLQAGRAIRPCCYASAVRILDKGVGDAFPAAHSRQVQVPELREGRDKPHDSSPGDGLAHPQVQGLQTSQAGHIPCESCVPEACAQAEVQVGQLSSDEALQDIGRDDRGCPAWHQNEKQMEGRE